MNKNALLPYIKLKAHKMLLALLIFSNIILNLTESHFIQIIHIKSYNLDCVEDHLKLVALLT